MKDTQLENLVNEIIDEQHISQSEKKENIKSYVKDAEFDINESSGASIDYTEDLKAKRLLKNYVMYVRHGRLAEFKELYRADYANLQAKYYKPSDV